MDLPGCSLAIWQAVPMPDRPAPMIRTSKCCVLMASSACLVLWVTGLVEEPWLSRALPVLTDLDILLSFPDTSGVVDGQPDPRPEPLGLCRPGA